VTYKKFLAEIANHNKDRFNLKILVVFDKLVKTEYVINNSKAGTNPMLIPLTQTLKKTCGNVSHIPPI
jgi:hypothetical protein